MNKQPHVFTWDNEPTDERPSVFEASTHAPTESWFDALPADHVKTARRPALRRSLTSLLLSFAALLSLCGLVLYGLSTFLRG